MKFYFLLQYRRLTRDIKNFGVPAYAGLAIASLSFVFFSILFFRKIHNAPVIYAVMAMIPLYFLGSESRNQFLKSIFLRKLFLPLRILENLIYILPFAIFLITKKQYLISLAVFIAGILFSLLNQTGYRGNFVIPSPFSKKPYEFTTGFRSTFWLLIAVYLITGISVFYHNFNLGLFCLLCTFFLCMGYYTQQPPVYYVWIHAATAKRFLKGKIETGLVYSFYLTLPVLLTLGIFYPSQIWPALIVFAIGLLYVLLGVLNVFVNFPGKMSASQSLQLAFSIVFPPALLFIIPNFYLQAIRRLKDYLQC